MIKLEKGGTPLKCGYTTKLKIGLNKHV